MAVYNIVDSRGRFKKRVLRNCDRVCNIQDAKGKFKAEVKDSGLNFWRVLSEWLLEEYDSENIVNT